MEESYNGGNPLALPVLHNLHKRYRIGRVLGAGGFGITYMAEDLLNHMTCAVKEYVPLGICGRDYEKNELYPLSEKKGYDYEHGKKRFMEEAKVLLELQHIPNIVRITDYFEENNTAYYVMEYLDGATLRQIQKCMPDNKIPLADAMEVISLIGQSLDRIHKEKQLLHRDISPDNIIYTRKGEIKLIDFGSAKHAAQGEKNCFSIVLKPGYAPPEQYSQNKSQGCYTDEYALAGTFYCLVTGRMPTDAMSRMTGKSLISVCEIEPSMPRQMWQVLQRAMSLEPNTRYPYVGQFIQALKEAYAEYAGNVHKENSMQQTPVWENNASAVMKKPFIEIVMGKENGRKWYLPENVEIRIGRSQNCQIALTGYSSISKIHLVLLYNSTTDSFFVQDLSTNGTKAMNRLLVKALVYQVPKKTVLILAESVGIRLGVEYGR